MLRRIAEVDTPLSYANERVSVKAKIGYGVGDFAANFVFQFIVLYLMFYLTEVFKINPTIAGIIFLIAKVWDAIFAPIMGYIADHVPYTKWGQKRPFLLFGAVPAGIAFFFLLASPPLSYFWKIVYAQVLFLILCTCYLIVNIPYSSLTSNLSLNSYERGSISAYRMFFAILGAMVVATITKPIVAFFSHPGIGFRSVGIIYSCIFVFFTVVTFFSIKERPLKSSKDSFKLKDISKVVFYNHPFLLLLLGTISYLVAVCLFLAGSSYFLKYNIRNESFSSIGFFCLYVSAALALPLLNLMGKKIEKKTILNMGMGLLGIIFIILYFVKTFTMPLFVFLFILIGVGVSSIYLAPWSMVSDTVEYSEWKTGLRREGTLYGLFMFGQMVSPGIAGFIVGVMLQIGGYLPEVSQSPQALFSIRLIVTFIPVCFIVIGMMLISRYSLSYQVHQEILKKLGKQSS